MPNKITGQLPGITRAQNATRPYVSWTRPGVDGQVQIFFLPGSDFTQKLNDATKNGGGNCCALSLRPSFSGGVAWKHKPDFIRRLFFLGADSSIVGS